MTSDFINRICALKDEAHAGPIGKRQSSFDLYRVLVGCYRLALQCRLQQEDADALRRLVREEACDGKGRWTLPGSDEFILVCRYVFPRASKGKGELANASRYAAAMREAEKRQMTPEDLADFLKNKGGVNALYLTRPLDRTDIQTKTLYLDRTITVSKHHSFTLTLKRMDDNRFEVVEMSA